MLLACASDDDEATGPPAPPSSAATATESTSTATASTATASTATASTAPTNTAPTARVYDFSAVGPIVQEIVDRTGLDGAGLVVVERDDGIVHEQYWGEFDADRISLIASASKMIAVGVLLRLDDDGLLDIDAPVADVVEWGAAHPDITPAQLLSNSSGLPGLLDPAAAIPHRCAFRPDGTLQECAEEVFTTRDDDLATIPPDTEFRYGGAQWQVAGAVAEVASGRSWADLIEEFYVEPCGLDTLAFNNHWAQFRPGGFVYPDDFDGDPATLEATDNPNIEGGAYTTPRDYAELLLMHLRDGRCPDERVVSAAAIERMHADRILDAYDGTAPGGQGYGLGWWIDRQSGRINDNGAFGAVPWLDVDGGFGAYLVVEQDVFVGIELANALHQPVEDAITAAR